MNLLPFDILVIAYLTVGLLFAGTYLVLAKRHDERRLHPDSEREMGSILDHVDWSTNGNRLWVFLFILVLWLPAYIITRRKR